MRRPHSSHLTFCRLVLFLCSTGLAVPIFLRADTIGVECSAQGNGTFKSSGEFPVTSPTSCSTPFAFASANLAAPGGVSLEISNSVGPGGGGYSVAFMWDVLTFSHALPGQTFSIAMASDPTMSSRSGDGFVGFAMGWTFAPQPVTYAHDLHVGGVISNLPSPKRCNGDFCEQSPDGTNFIASLSNIPMYAPIQLEFVLWGCTDGPTAACGTTLLTGNGGSVHYVDPITLTLPPGVTYTSESGLFLKDAPAAPEPSTVLLLGSGLIVMLVLFRCTLIQGDLL
jgi:hypothetical protein